MWALGSRASFAFPAPVATTRELVLARGLMNDGSPSSAPRGHPKNPIAGSKRGGFPGADLLVGTDPLAVMRRISEGDPLDLIGRAERRLRQRAFFIALQRLLDRLVAHVGLASMRYEGQPPLGVWIDELIDRSIADLICEDAGDERRGIAPTTPWDPDYAMMSELTGAEPARARAMCVAFNYLPEEVRRTVFAVLVEGKTLNRWVAEGHGPPARSREMYQRGIETLLQARDPEQADPDRRQLDGEDPS